LTLSSRGENPIVPSTQITLRIDKIKDRIGVEANGIDLRQPLDAASFQRLHDALIDHVALVIRDQKFTAANSRTPPICSAN